MNLKKLAENYPKDFFNYAEKILDSYLCISDSDNDSSGSRRRTARR